MFKLIVMFNNAIIKLNNYSIQYDFNNQHNMKVFTNYIS